MGGSHRNFGRLSNPVHWVCRNDATSTWSKQVKLNLIRTSALALALTLGLAAALPTLANPSQAANPATPASTNQQVLPVGYLPGLSQAGAVSFEIQAPDDCSPVTHQNFCYCTGSPCHD